MDRCTMRLWLFAPSSLEEIAPQLNRRYRWAHLVRLGSDERPRWSLPMGGVAWIANEGSGEYQGCFGYPPRGPDYVEPSAIEKTHAKRHADWSSFKRRRAIEQADRARAGRLASMEDWRRHRQDAVAFLRDLCRAGPVTIVLDDGGLVPIEEGGTKGATSGSLRVRSEEAVAVEVGSEDLDRALPPPFWTPVTFRSAGSTTAGESTRRA